MLLDLFFPKFCLGCNKPGIYLCLSCEKKLQYLHHDRCAYCKKSSLYGLTHPPCRRENGIESTMSIFHYSPLFKKIIKTVKYGLATKVLEELFLSIHSTTLYKLTIYKKLQGEFYLHPIPLHEERLRERGFNQALLISLFFQKFVDVPILEVLERTKATKSQAQISSLNERWQNLRGAFTLTKKDSIYNKDIILIDDVMTTGSTILSAAYTLKKNGARTVHALTLAHG